MYKLFKASNYNKLQRHLLDEIIKVVKIFLIDCYVNALKKNSHDLGPWLCNFIQVGEYYQNQIIDNYRYKNPIVKFPNFQKSSHELFHLRLP